MPDLLADLIDDFKGEIQTLLDGVAGGQVSSTQFSNSLIHLLGEFGSAGYMVGADVDDLTDADKRRILRYVADQTPYVNGFADAIDAAQDFSDGWRARGDMYANSIRAAYAAGATRGVDLPAMPCDGSTPCLSNCTCSWVEQRGGWYWVLGSSDHCASCRQRAREWAPYRG